MEGSKEEAEQEVSVEVTLTGLYIDSSQLLLLVLIRGTSQIWVTGVKQYFGVSTLFGFFPRLDDNIDTIGVEPEPSAS